MRLAPFALVVLLAAPTAFAGEDPTDPTVLARVQLMRAMKADLATLGDMAAGKVPFDEAAAEAAVAAFLARADTVEAAYKDRADDPASDGLPDIWTARAEFRQKENRLMKAAMGLDWSSPGDLEETLAPVAAACKDCHGRFRM